jgi:hypothetical protein
MRRLTSPRQQEQRPVEFRKHNNLRHPDNHVVRSERRATGKRDFKRDFKLGNRANGRRLRCAGGRC